MAREITPEEVAYADELIARARKAMDEIKDYDQAQVDRLARAGLELRQREDLRAHRPDGRR